MASVWERFSDYVKRPKGDDLDYYKDSPLPDNDTGPSFRSDSRPVMNDPTRPDSSPAYRIPAEVEASQYRNLLSESQPVARSRDEKVPSFVNEQNKDEFTSSPESEGTTAAEANNTGVYRMQLPAVDTFSRDSPASSELSIPYWLEDEDTLRDEGVLFGLSQSDPTEKTDIIYNYFQHLAADHVRNVEQQNERVQELNLFIGQKENRIQELQAKLRGLDQAQPEGEHQLPRTLVGLVLSIAMCVGNYYLIEETLRPAFASSSFVALGIFLAGMFNLFGRISLFHDTESSVSWRRLLEEVGMPLAAALFVFAQAWQTQSWWQAAALFVFVFFLFLFAGKLFLSNITVLRNDLRLWLTTVRGRREAIAHNHDWQAEITQLNHEIDELRVKKWQVLREQSNSESERDRLSARRDMLIKLFESEFYLARKMKGQLSERQLREIRGS
ncbi:hypothetical protein [Persicitalea jodogahamensis]|uniref:Uncharacterized protein n=1 Tax=Persicitalea jodogahamensis TaxID=402147 RepID=A0A8J3D440_9BACT|nr:hypothetical protein [Persicitalea jodogahamensis]GHB69751.1 hypothetical protein GCM10007390_24210 [Persicitalea jodogahamensis]